MADNLVFPIKFDLEAAVRQAQGDADRLLRRLQTTINAHPLGVNLRIDGAGNGSIDNINARIGELVKRWNSLTEAERIANKTSGEYTAEAKNILAEYTRLIGASESYARSLQQINAAARRSANEQEKMTAKQRAAWEKLRKTISNNANSIDALSAKIKAYQQRLNGLEVGSAKFEKTAAKIKALSQQLERAKQRMAELTDRGPGLARSVNEVTQAFHNQDGYISRLLKRMAVYAGYSMIGSFLTNVREITAQFELQRVSLGAIIQDQQRANQIFAEIKSFALTSPLKILDLTKYTKQVAAYGFEADKLFETTKMLADISVGLGTDMSRATLFLGQVYATGYLRASELKQATEMGIPLVAKLADKLEELNGKAYSAADVMDLISKRAIGYDMVEQVFKDMTSAGGEFYNMQIKQSQTLFGMWSKLGDAAALMYDEIGNTSSVNAGMKSAMGALETMMRNWKTTARVLDSVAVAMTVYIVGLKNAAVASKALTTAEATKLAIMNKQIIATPKLIASIFGQNAATRLSTTLTKAHTAAMIRQSAATSILSKGFWKLTAAMLANPWVAAAAAIGGVVAAIIHFTGNAETAAERAEKLNNSVASLKNLEDTTKPLIDAYNELINKTERTVEEQKKLSEVTHELAKQYPGAITAIGNFGAEVELAADKLNQLYQAEKQARMDNTRYELGETEKKIKEVEAEIEKYQQRLASGEKTIYKRLGDSSFRTKKVVPLTEEDKGNILKRIDGLRYGEDGQSGLFGLQQSAEAARRALGLIPSEAAQAVEKFGAWKKTFTTFRQQVGDVRVQLFDDSTINQFGSLEKALKKTAEEYKKNIALVATYDDVLKSTTLTAEERAKIEGERAEADTMATLAKKALDYYNTLPTAFDKNKSDPRLQTLQEIANKMAEVNKEYGELLKKEGQTKALADIQKLFASSFKQMEATAKKYGFKLPAFEVPQTIEDVQKWYKAIMDNIKRLNLKNADKVLIELGFKSDKAAIDKQQKDIEQQLKSLSDRISRTKTAKEFYEKILSQTGDVELATRVSLSIYGSTGEKLYEGTVEQIREVFKSGKEDVVIDLAPVFDMTNQRIDYKMLADIYDKYQDSLIAANKETAKKIAQDGQKEVAANISNWQKELAKAQSFEEQRTEIVRRESERRAKIIKETRDPKERNRLVSLSYDKQAQELAKLAVDEFKSSDDYIKVFQDLDRVSSQTLDRMKKRLQEMIATVKDTENVDGLKSLVEQLDKINEERETRNPIEGVIDSFKEYAKARKDFRTAEANEAKVKAEFAEQELGLNMAVQTAKAEQVVAQQRVIDLEAQGKLNTDEGVAAQLALNDATTKVTQATEKRNKAVKEVNDAEQETTDALDAQKSAIAKLSKNVNAMANAFSSAASSISAIAEMMGIAEDSELGDIVNGLVSGLNNAATIMTTILAIAIAIEAACWWLLAIGGAIAVFSAIGSWLTGAKVRKANKEIARQAELLEQLEYSYNRLEKAAEKLFGSDYIRNYNQQLKLLEAEAEAYRKQAEAERSKGKKTDKDRLKEYEDAYRDTLDEIADMEGKLAEQMTGTDVASAARDFAKAWLDARLSFGNTKEAIEGEFKDMIKNMVTESAAARIVQSAMQPFFDDIDEMYESGAGVNDVVKMAVERIGPLTEQITDGLEVWYQSMLAQGVDLGNALGDKGDFTGIAKRVTTATSEEVNANTAALNTQNYYVSHLPGIAVNVALMRQMMETGGITEGRAVDLTGLQDKAMARFAQIEANTAATVKRLDSLIGILNRVVAPKGSQSTHGVTVYLHGR